MSLSRSHNQSHIFGRLTHVDSIHFLGPFLIEFLISPRQLNVFLVFFFQFHPSILGFFWN
jgi:hypothetical protein